MYYWTILNFNKLLCYKLLPLKTQRLSQTFCPKNYAAKFRTQTTIMEVSEWFILSHSTHQLLLSTSKRYTWANLIEWSKTLNFLAAKASMFLVFYSGSRSLPLHLDLLADSLDVSLKIGWSMKESRPISLGVAADTGSIFKGKISRGERRQSKRFRPTISEDESQQLRKDKLSSLTKEGSYIACCWWQTKWTRRLTTIKDWSPSSKEAGAEIRHWHNGSGCS